MSSREPRIASPPSTRAITDTDGLCEIGFTGKQAPFAQAIAAGAMGFLNGETPCLTAAQHHGFRIDEAEVVYWGTCPECH